MCISPAPLSQGVFELLDDGLEGISSVFEWPGLGRIMIIAIEVRDYPLVLGILFMLSLIILILNLITDLIYTILDPRINFGSYG